MPLQIVRNDITMMACDAIVNAANPQLAGGGGVDGAIHRAAGPDLHEACMKLGGCQTGQAKLTKGFDLPCKYIIHTVGPVWVDGTQGEKELLESCYRESLLLAKKKRCKTVAFPLISAGVYGYPKDQALRVAVNTISEFLLEHDMQVILVVYDKTCFQISKQLVTDIEEYIDECYIKEHYQGRREFIDRAGQSVYNMPPQSAPQRMAPQMQEEAKGLFQGRFAKRELQIMLGQIDESFSQMLLRKIDEKGMTDAQCYKKANIDRKLFFKDSQGCAVQTQQDDGYCICHCAGTFAGRDGRSADESRICTVSQQQV